MSADIPDNPVTPADLAEWYTTKKQMANLAAKEILLRMKIFRYYFPAPEEGTNTSAAIDETGAVIKGGHVINRSVDPGALQALREEMKPLVDESGVEIPNNHPKINLDTLVKWKPEVAISEYRKLTEEERHFFDRCLVIKPGTPSVEITIPKRAQK